MRQITFTMIAVLAILLSATARAAELPAALEDYLPDAAVEAAEEGGALFSAGLSALLDELRGAFSSLVKGTARSAVRLVLAALLCGAAEGFCAATGAARYVPLCGVLAVTSLAAGELDSLIGQGSETIERLGTLSSALLPTVAAAMAAGGRAATATAWQVGTMLGCDVLLAAARGLIVPLIECFVALSAAGAVLPDSPLDRLAGGLKKGIGGALCGGMLLFTLWLSVTGVISGTADRAALRVTKAAISHAVPVVGDILADASEVLLSGADSLRATLGAAGLVAVLGVCMMPLVRLGVGYLLYQAAAMAASVAGLRQLDTLIARLGEAMALMLGTAGAAAMLLCVSMVLALAVST